MAKFKAGDVAYIVESNNLVREVTIKRHSGGFYLVALDTGGWPQSTREAFVSDERRRYILHSEHRKNTTRRDHRELFNNANNLP